MTHHQEVNPARLCEKGYIKKKDLLFFIMYPFIVSSLGHIFLCVLFFFFFFLWSCNINLQSREVVGGASLGFSSLFLICSS